MATASGRPCRRWRAAKTRPTTAMQRPADLRPVFFCRGPHELIDTQPWASPDVGRLGEGAHATCGRLVLSVAVDCRERGCAGAKQDLQLVRYRLPAVADRALAGPQMPDDQRGDKRRKHRLLPALVRLRYDSGRLYPYLLLGSPERLLLPHHRRDHRRLPEVDVRERQIRRPVLVGRALPRSGLLDVQGRKAGTELRGLPPYRSAAARRLSVADGRNLLRAARQGPDQRSVCALRRPGAPAIGWLEP